jgi:hypothetical protein
MMTLKELITQVFKERVLDLDVLLHSMHKQFGKTKKDLLEKYLLVPYDKIMDVFIRMTVARSCLRKNASLSKPDDIKNTFYMLILQVAPQFVTILSQIIGEAGKLFSYKRL